MRTQKKKESFVADAWWADGQTMMIDSTHINNDIYSIVYIYRMCDATTPDTHIMNNK